MHAVKRCLHYDTLYMWNSTFLVTKKLACTESIEIREESVETIITLKIKFYYK